MSCVFKRIVPVLINFINSLNHSGVSVLYCLCASEKTEIEYSVQIEVLYADFY